MLKNLLITIVIGFAYFNGSLAWAQSKNSSDSVTVMNTMNDFLTSFINLEWEKFASHFREDATAFFPPSSKFPYRANNKSEIEKIFKAVFENAHKGKSQPPYLDIVPKEIRVQLLDSVAIVSFILEDPELIGRRTFILNKTKERWMIVHLHASGAMRTK
jgi:ketosteroid isomerase-like protein